jgi:hypothetical protein
MMRTRFYLVLLLLLGSITPAFAELKGVRVAPAQPSRCDPVAITALGVLPDECHQIVRATIEGPLQVCVGDLCPEQFFVNITVRQPNPAATCLAVNVPYTRLFRVGTLPPGDYVIGARERVIPYYLPDSTDSIVSETFASLAFTVRAESTCVGTGCYVVSFHDPDRGSRLGCDEITPPGGTACLPLSLGNSVNVGGLQTTASSFRWDVPTAPFLHVVSVEAVRRASGFQVSWSNDGPKTKILLYSTSGAVIPPGDGPVLRICYAVAPGTPPDRYMVTDVETIVADAAGNAINPCPTPAIFAPGVICVVTPGCDVNGDGISDILDIIRLVRCALASSNDACPDSVASRADCNGDGTIDIRDVICCVRKIVGADLGTTRASGSGQGSGSTSGSDLGNQIGFEGPVRWIDAATGVVPVRIDAAADWGGTQFSISANGVRLRGLKLTGGNPGVNLEWGIGEDGVARGILFGATTGAHSAWSGRLEVTLDRPSGGAGTLWLRDVRAGSTDGAPSLIANSNSSVPVDAAPVAAPVLLRARPNPFTARTEIAFVLPADARAELNVYDVHGRLVRSLVQGPMSAGTNRISWDGADGRGKAARSGIYFAKLRVGDVSRTERIMLLR